MSDENAIKDFLKTLGSSKGTPRDGTIATKLGNDLFEEWQNFRDLKDAFYGIAEVDRLRRNYGPLLRCAYARYERIKDNPTKKLRAWEKLDALVDRYRVALEDAGRTVSESMPKVSALDRGVPEYIATCLRGDETLPIPPEWHPEYGQCPTKKASLIEFLERKLAEPADDSGDDGVAGDGAKNILDIVREIKRGRN